MRFNPNARLDDSQVDVEGGGGGGGGGFRGGIPGIPGGGGMHLGLGGTILLIIIYLVFQFVGGGGGTTPQSQTQGQAQGQSQGQGQSSDVTGQGTSQCRTGADANNNLTCRLVGITNAVQSFWSTELPKEGGPQYQMIRTHLFTGSTVTQGCGQASSQMGPFYCPNDQTVYLDKTFFSDMLQQLGGRDSGFTEAYVVAHEYGHHIENLLGLMGKVRTQQGPMSDSVKLELMADCLAGVWAKNATTAKDANGQVLIQNLTQQDIKDAIDAATTVGDDRIQKRMQGQVNPESWTHGDAKQRTTAFSTGYQDGQIRSCDYFDGAQMPTP